MKRCGRLLLALMIILCPVGCTGRIRLSEQDANVYEKIHRYYSKMERYSARVRLTVKGNRTENEYLLEQYAEGNDKTLARIILPEELAGAETISNGERFMIRFAPIGTETGLETAEETDCLFVNRFLSRYYQSEETALTVNGTNGETGTTLLETELPSGKALYRKASMLIDNKTLAPKNITLYDMGGNIVSVAEFEKFVYNDTFEDEIFEIVS